MTSIRIILPEQVVPSNRFSIFCMTFNMKKLILIIGLFASINVYSQGWQLLNTGLTTPLKIYSMYFTPQSNYQTGYAVGGQYYQTGLVIKTTDGGDTWSAPVVVTGDILYGVWFIDDNTGFVCSANGKVFMTTDGGAGWTIVLDDPTASFGRIVFKDSQIGVVGGTGVIYTTFNGGLAWIPSPGGSAYNVQDITWGGGNTWYLAGYEKVAKSTDNGVGWTTIHNQAGDLLLGIDSRNSSTLAACGDYGYIYLSNDAGVTWSSLSVDDMLFHDILYVDSCNIYACATPGMIYKSTDGGASFTNTDYLGDFGMFSFFKTDSNWIYVSGSSGNIWRKQDTATLGPVVYAGPDTTICAGDCITLSSATASNCNSVTWATFGDGTFSAPSVVNPTYCPGSADTLAGTVTLVMEGIGSAFCGTSTAIDYLILTIIPCSVGIEGFESTGDFLVYPNPVTDIIYLPVALQSNVISIMDATGRLVMEKRNTQKIEMGNLQPGIYFLKAYRPDNSFYRTVIIKN